MNKIEQREPNENELYLMRRRKKLEEWSTDSSRPVVNRDSNMMMNRDNGNEFENKEINTNKVKDDNDDIAIIKEVVIMDEIPSQTTIANSPCSTVYNDVHSSFSPLNSDSSSILPISLKPIVATTISDKPVVEMSDIIPTIDAIPTVNHLSATSGLFTATHDIPDDESVKDIRNRNIGSISSSSNDNSFTIEKDENNTIGNSATDRPITPSKGPYNSDYCLDLAALYPVSPTKGPYSSRTNLVKPSPFK
jgi:hypothetical protein